MDVANSSAQDSDEFSLLQRGQKMSQMCAKADSKGEKAKPSSSQCSLPPEVKYHCEFYEFYVFLQVPALNKLFLTQ